MVSYIVCTSQYIGDTFCTIHKISNFGDYNSEGEERERGGEISPLCENLQAFFLNHTEGDVTAQKLVTSFFRFGIKTCA
jgi:hypothetical protein